MAETPEIYAYLDYRAFLADWYAAKKRANPKFSYRLLAAKVGFKSPGHFSMILKGQANISIAFIESLAEAAGLGKKEKEYFQALVLYNQAKTPAESRKRLERLTSLRPFPLRTLSPDEYEFLQHWRHMAVREALALRPFKGDYRELGRTLEPPATAEEARRSVDLLLRLGLVRKNAQGAYERAEPVLTTGYRAPAEAVNPALRSMLRLAEEAIDRFPREERNLSWLTLSVSRARYREIVEELRAFRRRVLSLAKDDPDPEEVYQFNFQVFPLSRSRRSSGAGKAEAEA